MEFVKSNVVKANLNAFFFCQSEDMLNLCLNLNELQPRYAYKLYAYKK